MKDVFKCFGLLIVGLFVAVIGYPFLHETGHSIIALAVGAKVIDFSLLPLPYVICEISMINGFGLILIGLSGMYLPMIFSLIIRPKSFWFWYGILITKGICILSFVISLVSIVLYNFGVNVLNEDIVQIMNIFEKGDLILSIFVDSYAAFKDGEKWGFVDTEGNVVIEAQYDDAKSFSNRMGAVKNGEVWSFINPQNKVVIEETFEDVDYLNAKGICFVKIDGYWSNLEFYYTGE